MFEEGQGVRVSVATMSRAVRTLGWTFKKVDGVLRAGRAKKEILPIGDPSDGVRREHRRGEVRLCGRVFDEHLAESHLCDLWAPKGERAFGKAPRNWGKNVSLICAICAIDASLG